MILKNKYNKSDQFKPKMACEDNRSRIMSESSDKDDFDGMGMEPLNFDDLVFFDKKVDDQNSDEDFSPTDDCKISMFSIAMSLRRKNKGCPVMPLQLRLFYTSNVLVAKTATFKL